jgi:molybdate-binding protein
MNTIEQHFAGKEPQVRKIYDALLRASRVLGPFEEDPKKTSIHLARKSAFAGVATRKDNIILTIKAASDIKDPRVINRQQASANRWHLDIRLREAKDVDAQLERWLKEAYELAG